MGQTLGGETLVPVCPGNMGDVGGRWWGQGQETAKLLL